MTRGRGLTRMISKSISWSTCMNFWSHSSISVVFLRASDSSSWACAGSLRWCSHHSMTFRRTASFTCIIKSVSSPISAVQAAEDAGRLVTYIGDGNRVGDVHGFAHIVEEVLDEDRAFSYSTIYNLVREGHCYGRRVDGKEAGGEAMLGVIALSIMHLPTSMMAWSLDSSRTFCTGLGSAIVLDV